MKYIVQLVFAAILGSLITLGAYYALDLDKKVVYINEANDIPSAKLTDYQANKNTHISNAAQVLQPNPTTPKATSNAIPIDFRAAASQTTPAVVHITAKQNVKQARNSRRGNKRGGGQQNPMDLFDFFGGEDFFGPDFFRGFGDQRPKVGTGSGVIISADGYIVTNNHVVEGADEVEITMNDNRTFDAQVIGTDPSTDLALIKVESTNLPILDIANSDEVEVGEWVLAVGNPFNLASTVTAGIVSAKARNISILKDKAAIESFIQTDAAVNPGNSGGALVNTNGELVGINTAIATPTGTYAGYSFAVPSNIVKKVISDLMDFGIVQRGFLGVMIRDLNGNLAEELGLKITQGVYVDSLMSDGSAKQSGIEKGDVIIKVDGLSVKSAPELQELIGRHRPGDMVNVTVSRNNSQKDIVVVLKNHLGNTEKVSKEKTAALDVLGVEVAEVSKETAEKLGIKGGIQVKAMKRGKISQYTDIQEGFIITKIGEQTITTIDELNTALANKKGGVLLEGIYPEEPTSSYYYGFGM